MITLPTRTDAARYDFDIDLEGKTYHFEFHWNEVDASWYFELSDALKNPLLSGRKVVLGFPLLGRFHNPDFPPGDLIATDTSGKDVQPGINELGTRVVLVYTEAALWGRS